MQQLILSAQQVSQQNRPLPFSIYRSVHEQRIMNVPIIKPMLICVLQGYKQLGVEGLNKCQAGSFAFLSNMANDNAVNIRNIPAATRYFALIIEFEFEDFDCFKQTSKGQVLPQSISFQGELASGLVKSLQQFVEWSIYAPEQLWPSRRQELLQWLYYSGYKQVAEVIEPHNLSHQVYRLVSANVAEEQTATQLASHLAMSESTLRRKLSVEGTSVQAIKDNARLSHGLHLIQSSFTPIGLVAEQCGYQSPSRFTDKFKQLFGVTPSALRKTRMNESGD